MVIVQVYVRVKEKDIDAFIKATIENASNSIKEPDINRFDFMQENEDPGSFLLTEIYANERAPKDHKKTDHYLKWRETVADMMDKPRKGVTYHEIFPKELRHWSSK